MATNDKQITATQIKPPSLSDTQARDSFIAVALGQIVAYQMAENKVDHAMAGTLAVRYANWAMSVRGTETAVLNLVMKKGVAVAVAPPPPVTVPDVQPPPVMAVKEEKPPSIAELIGEAPELAEVK